MVKMEELLETAKRLGASDVHITVGVPPKMRISGELKDTEYDRLTPEDTERLLSGIMNEGQKKMLDEKGEADFSFAVPALGRFRANVFKQRGSYAAALRLVLTEIADADILGIPKNVMELSRLRRGLVLITGTAGSGKSTTLAALIDRINSERAAHVITLEDPIEYLHQHKKAIVNQREIGIDSDSYAQALRAALRENPDVIMLGEVQDCETIRTAIDAAEAGYLVFSTMHTMGAANTVLRLLEMFPAAQQQQIRLQLASVLSAVVSQQLVPSADEQRRVAVFEIMLMNQIIKNLIRDGKMYQIGSAMQEEKKNGMQMMDDALLELYLRGTISKETVLASAVDVYAIQQRIL